MKALLVLVALLLAAVAAATAGGSATAERAPCPVTLPNRSGSPASAFSHGTRRLRVGMYWRGTVAAGLRPDGSVMATIEEDGAVSMKVGWWRGVPGRLRITGRRLDGQAPPLRVVVPEGYGSLGFQVTGLVFPTVGCWRVGGRVRDARLSFVVRITKLPQ